MASTTKALRDRVGQHDVASGLPVTGTELPALIERGDRRHAFWERQVHACAGCLIFKDFMKVDEMRRCIEQLDPNVYETAPYYEKWATAIATVMLERNVVSNSELSAELGDPEGSATEFKAGDVVRVRTASLATRWRRPHLRTPGYVHGVCGTVERFVGHFCNPERLAFGGAADKQPLYIVRFDWRSICYFDSGEGAADTVTVEIYHSWLESASKEDLEQQLSQPAARPTPAPADVGSAADVSGPDCKRQRMETIEHRHEHRHEERKLVEQRAVDAEIPQPAIARALVAVLHAKGVVTPEELCTAMERTNSADQHRGVGGRRVVARAWVDADFRERLLRDANAACSELGLQAANPTPPTRLVVVEHTLEVHHIIVCTLCSCYPLSLLGLSPDWYKSREYRSRAVREPRAVLREFGTVVSSGKRVEVHDSTADCRYLVLPERPIGTDGWSEEQLQAIVTRDSMIGISVIEPPAH